MQQAFQPQFHKRVMQDGRHSVWIALPYPQTLIPLKTKYYREWQLAECVKLQEGGATIALSENDDCCECDRS